MKKIYSSMAYCVLLIASNAHADFSGAYAFSNWDSITDGGSIVTSTINQSVTLTSSDDLSNDEKNQDYTVQVLANSVINFYWQYDTTDDTPEWDPFGYLLNNKFYQLSNDKGPKSQQGYYSVSVSSNDIFGFRANSEDSRWGSAVTKVTEFSATNANQSAVPLPAAVWLFGTGLFGFLWQSKRR
jgi:PEP-CTERM motif